jgi:Zn-dependent peptidase ImmA (M78 family)
MLVEPVPKLRAVRFRSFKTLKSRKQILVDVGRWLQDFNELEGLLEERRSHSRGLLDLARKVEDPVRAADKVRELFGLGVEEPIRDLCGLLESRGIKVMSLDVASEAFFGLSVAAEDGGPAIAVNTWERISVERQIFTAAHELGHLVLHLPAYRVEEKEEGEEQEREANLFASHFLMPASAFEREWQATYGMGLVDRVLKVKRIFRVSYRTVLYRLSEDAGENLWKSFQVQYRRRFGKSLMKRDEPLSLAADAFRASSPEPSRAGEPERLSASDFVEDRLMRLVREAIEKGAITLSRGSEILGLRLNEMRELSASWVG